MYIRTSYLLFKDLLTIMILHMTGPHMDPIPYILPYTTFYAPVQLIWASMELYKLMSYLIPFYNISLLARPYGCLILTPWMSDPQQILSVQKAATPGG